jgi:hypothetical protein
LLFCRPILSVLERLAELTICTICESKVSEPIFRQSSQIISLINKF